MPLSEVIARILGAPPYRGTAKMGLASIYLVKGENTRGDVVWNDPLGEVISWNRYRNPKETSNGC
jgi:hypothetical protein